MKENQLNGVDHAKQAAIFFGQQEHIQDVFLVGSLAREGDGNDVDLVVTTSLDRASKWAEMARVAGDPSSLKDLRSSTGMASDALEIDFLSLARQRYGPDGTKRQVDLFVFPHHWREDVAGVQELVSFRDPDFVQNLARDAKRFIFEAREFI